MKMLWALVLSLAGLGGCASYTTPGGKADFSQLGLTDQAKAALTDPAVQEILDKRPLVTFPAAIAVARVQSHDYQTGGGRFAVYGGNYSVVSEREVEREADFAGIAQLPGVRGVAGIKRILLDSTLNSDLELRAAAAKLHAGLLLFYTFDTRFETQTSVRPLGVITLGLAPNKNARVVTTASAVLMDTSNGYIYGVYESTSKQEQLANAWTSAEAMDQIRKQAERAAFADLVEDFRKEWPNVVATYTPKTSKKGG